MTASGPRDGEDFRDQSSRVRSVLFRGELVSRLCCLLRGLGRRKKTYAIVAQISRRKPVLKKPLSDDGVSSDAPDSACPAPSWQRGPVRVSFEPAGGTKQTFAIRGHAADLVNDSEEEEEGSK